MATADAIAVHHRLEGREDAPAVVLSSSVGTTLELWDAQVPALGERFRVLRYDHRGQGRSPVPPGPYGVADLGADLLDLLDRLGIERASICGLSLGGMVGMWVASHAPERVERLALCCTSAHPAPRETWEERAAAVRAHGMGAVADAVVERWFTPGFRRRSPEVVARFTHMLLGQPPEGYAACCEAIRDFDLRDRLGSIAAPTLVVAGADDPATPPDHARVIEEGIPDASLLVLDEAAHLANVERADEVTSALVEHLTGGAAGP
jgi:3-oxoadipate enol-lactonase